MEEIKNEQELQAPQQQSLVSAEKQAAAKPQPKRNRLSFGKVFLAALLAVVVGSVVSFLFWISLFSGLSALVEPQTKPIPESAILKIDFKECLTDAPSKSPFNIDFATMQPISSLTLFNALQAIEAAESDDRIKGIYINITGTGSATADLLEELREAIVKFKQSGKFVVAYNEVYSQWMYYFCSVADKVYMQPEGTFSLTGLSLSTMFYKGLIDKLGVEVDILRPTVCKYKSAVEPFFLDKMSEANRAQMQALADNMWSVLTEAVSASRGISVEELNRLTNELAVNLPQEALDHKLIDGLKYQDQMEELFKEEYGIEDLNFVSLGDYAKGLTPDVSKLSAPKVAIVYANGQVMDGNGSDDNIYGYTMAREIREVADDEDVKAVVLRVNSPGGSALASDIIWREVELLKAKKPVIVSMGSYAASGGYYISAPADAIVADKLTLTGSIGVFGMLPSVGKALKDKVGITVDAVNTNTYSDMGNGFSALKPAEYQALMKGVDRVYERFTSLVAQGRNLTIEKVLEIAEGRVWSGAEAQKIGLVDTCGGLTAAIAIAVDKAELGENYQIVEKKSAAEGFMAILEQLGGTVKASITKDSELVKLYEEYKNVEQIITRKGIYTYCPYDLTIE